MPVTITAKKDGFRRCGMAHSGQSTTHPDGRFTPGQLAILQAEPMLVVHVTAPEPEKPKADGEAAGKALADMTKAELAAWLEERKAAYPTNATKAELLALAQAKAAEEAKAVEGSAE